MAFKIYCIFIFSSYIPFLFTSTVPEKTNCCSGECVRSQFFCLLPVECDRRPLHPSPETTVVFTTKVVSSSDLCCMGTEMGGVPEFCLAPSGLYPFLVPSCFVGAAMQPVWGDVFAKCAFSKSPLEIDQH